MLSLSILFCMAAAVVRRSDFEVTVNDAAEMMEDSKLEAETEIFSSTHCGDGETAEYDCVRACMDDKQCRGQAEVMAAIQATGVFKTEEINNGNSPGHGYTTDSPCASFYGDNAGRAGMSFGFSMSSTMTYCHKGDHDAAECIDGKCVAINDDVECTGNAWKDPKKCKIRHVSCGTVTECAERCMKDKNCREQVIVQAAADPVLNSALKVRCVQEEGGEKKCFFTPGNACSDKCQDAYECRAGRCSAVSEIKPVWKVPEKGKGAFAWMTGKKNEEEEQQPNTGRFAWITGGTKSSEHKCKHFWQSCKGEWTKPADPAADPGCSKCMLSSSCCVKA